MNRKLSDPLLLRMMYRLAVREANSMSDYSTRDMVQLAIDGKAGLDKLTDLELLDEHITMEKECECHSNQDAQIRAFEILRSSRQDPTDLQLIDDCIAIRRQKLKDESQLIHASSCPLCVAILTDIAQAKQELGL